MAWQTPKTDWTPPDGVTDADLNRIEGNIQELQNTKETPSGAQAKVDTHEAKAAPHSGHETPSGAQTKVDTHEAKAAPHSGHATTTALTTHTNNKSNPHTVTAAQTGAQILGAANTDVNKVKALEHKTDTRTAALTYTNGNLTKVEEKDGATVVKTTDLSYDVDGNLETVTETAGGVTVTTTLTYTDGDLTAVSKAVS
jgi:hypothetical protein